MNRLRRVIGNAVISLFGQAVTWSSSILLTIAYGRFLGDFQFGELYFAITFVALIGFPLEFGFNQQLTREVAQHPHKASRYLFNTLFIKMILWIILYSVIQLACWLLGYGIEQRILVAICGVTLLSGAIANSFAAIYYAFERVTFPVIGSILEKGLSALIGLIILKQGASVEAMALVLLGGSLMSALWQAAAVFRIPEMRAKFTIDKKLIRELLQTGIPFLLYGILGVIYYRLDTVLLSLMTNTVVVGWYGAGYRLFDTLVFLPNIIIMAIMYPVFSKLSISSEHDLQVAIEKSLNFLLFCGIPIATAMIVAAPSIIGFLYHRPEYVNSFGVLQAIAPGLVFLYANTVLSTIMMSTKQEKKITLMAAIALVFNLSFNLLLIPIFQHIGAAIVTSATEGLLFCLSLIFIPRRFIPWKSGGVAFKALMASIAMALAVMPLRATSIFVLIPLATAIYLGTATLLGTIPHQDIKALFTAVRNKAQRMPTPEAVPVPGIEYEITQKLASLDDDTTLYLPKILVKKSP